MVKKKTTVETAVEAATEATEAANIAETDIPNLDTQESGIEAFTDVAEVVTAEAEPDIYDLKNMPNAYGWNRETREYEGVVSPQKDPREKKWLLPGRSTWVKPPEAGEHQAVRYDNDAKAWELVADYRGETWYSKDTQAPHEIKEIGIDPAENDWTDVKPTDGAAKWDEESQTWKIPEEVTEERNKQQAESQANAAIDAAVRKQAMQTMMFSVSTFAMMAKAGTFFDNWAADTQYTKGQRIQYDGVIYEVKQDVTSQSHQTPASEGMLAIYRPLSVDSEGGEHAGTIEDPIPWIYGMDVEAEKYYSYNGKIYRAVQAQKPSVWEPGAAGTAAIWEFVQAEA